MEWTIPTISGSEKIVDLDSGKRVFVVGPNGSGKSALLQKFVSETKDQNVRRIVAHRPTAFRSEKISFAFQDRIQAERQIQNKEKNNDYRWKEDPNIGHEIQSIILSDLISKENNQARSVREYIRKNELDEATKESDESASAFGMINELFRVSNLNVSLILSEAGDILAVRQDNQATFSIAQMSDGERNAAIIAATVLTIEPETILLIDEPERHLHRSIILPFLSSLFSQRNDCAFVLSTHDLDLPQADPDAPTLLVRSCEWKNNTPVAWNIELLEGDSEVPENLKREILGSRKNILFVEGDEDSLDVMIYSALFSQISVYSKGNCIEVERAVTGLRSSQVFHHIDAFGIIDRDDREPAAVKDLAEKGVFALDACSVEALYYCSEAIDSVADRQAVALGFEKADLIQEAKSESLKLLGQDEVKLRMSARRCEQKVRNEILSLLPSWKEIRNGTVNSVSSQNIDTKTLLKNEIEVYNGYLLKKDYDSLICRYPIKSSGVMGRVSSSLHCQNRRDYERMVISRIKSDESFRRSLTLRMGSLPSYLV